MHRFGKFILSVGLGLSQPSISEGSASVDSITRNQKFAGKKSYVVADVYYVVRPTCLCLY